MQAEIQADAPRAAEFAFVGVANALRVDRPTLGNDAGVALYRLLRLVALEDIIGRGAAGTAYVAGGLQTFCVDNTASGFDEAYSGCEYTRDNMPAAP